MSSTPLKVTPATPAQEEVIRLATMRFWDTESRHIKLLHPALGLRARCGVFFAFLVMCKIDTSH